MKMSSFGANTRTVTFAPFIIWVVDNALSQTSIRLLLFIDVIHFRLVDSLLHFYPNLGQIWTVLGIRK